MQLLRSISSTPFTTSPGREFFKPLEINSAPSMAILGGTKVDMLAIYSES